MIDLHERLSEFSYGYGVTREAEKLLIDFGFKAAPFLPSLLQEGTLGFDVAFPSPGGVLLLQFKLGQSLERLVWKNLSAERPSLDRPFWRFRIDTAEPDGQFETLLKAEFDGAEVYYVAPRFSDWPEYLQAFESNEVLERSLLIKPSEIRNALIGRGDDDGPHQILYDNNVVAICSEPSYAHEEHIEAAVDRMHGRTEPLATVVKQLFVGLSERETVRRPRRVRPEQHEGSESAPMFMTPQPASEIDPRAARVSRLENFRARARSDIEAVAMAYAVENWSLGIQVIFASRE